MIGELVSHYRVTEKLGEGGMGVVYKAQDTRLQRPVAIKFLTHTGVATRSWERFQREARAASALNHPHICTIYDVGEHSGEPFLVMEFLEGETLAGKLTGKPLPADQVIEYGAQIADGLEAAQARGLMHRDIKPANIFVTSRGQVKILDFGLAKSTEADERTPGENSETVTKDFMTAPGSTIGTVSYMSPEQARGGKLDHRTDLFSVGVVLYEMATGIRPFQGSAQAVIFDGILNRAPESPVRLNPAVPADLERIILRALEKNRDHRYQTAADLGADLKRLRILSESSRVAVAASPRRASKAWIVAGALLAVVGAIAAYILSHLARTAVPQIVSMAPVTNSGHVVPDVIALSRDGRYLAYAEARGDQISLQLKQVATGSSVRVLPPEKTRYQGVAFSPDGNYLYVAIGDGRIGTLYQLPVLGGARRKLIEDVDGPVTFSPDGSQIAFVRFNSSSRTATVMTAHVDGTSLKTVATRPRAGFAQKLSWSPDGKTIAGLSRADDIVLFAVNGEKPRVFHLPGWKYVESFAWLSSGRGFVVTAEEDTAELTARHQILEVSYPEGQIRRLTRDLSDHHSLVASADLSTLAVVDLVTTANIWVGPANDPDKAERINGGRTQGSRGVAWTKDGRIVYAEDTGIGWVMNADGSGVRPFAADKHAVAYPSLCGPGPLLIFVGGTARIEVGDPDGTAPRAVADGFANFPTCTPDGKWAVYSSAKNELWKTPVDTGMPVRLLEYGHQGAVSPDGKWMAFHSSDPSSGVEKLAILPANGQGERKELDSGAVFFVWNPDSAGLTVVKTKDEVGNLWNLPLQGSAKQLTHFTADLIIAFARSQDGRIAIARGSYAPDVILIQRK